MITGSSVITVEQNGRQATYKFLATLDELKKTGQLTRWIDDHDVLLYEYEGEIKALSNICRHSGGRLDITSKRRCLYLPLPQMDVFLQRWFVHLASAYPLRQYARKVVDDKIYVDLLGVPAMKTFLLTAKFRAEMDCPKEVVMWNYYDHEHLVGTHYKINATRVLAEPDDRTLAARGKRCHFCRSIPPASFPAHGRQHHEELPSGHHWFHAGDGSVFRRLA